MLEINATEAVPIDFEGRDPNWWIDQILNDLFFLCKIVLRHGKTIEYRDLNWIHEELCDFLNPKLNPNPQIMVLMARDMLKSSIGRGMMIQWFLRAAYEKRQDKGFIFSGVYPLAQDHLEKIVREILGNQLLQAFFHGYIPGKREDFDVCRIDEGKIRYNGIELDAGSPEKTLTGHHYMLGMIDNLANEVNTETAEARLKTNKRWRQLESVFAENAREIIFETTWFPDDVSGIILEPNGKYDYQEIYRQPCRKFVSETGYAVFSCPAATGRGTIGTPVFPEKIDTEYLRRKKNKQGPYLYSALYELQPIPDEEVIIRPEWWQVYFDKLPENHVRNICVDAAGTIDKTKSQSAITIGEWDYEGTFYLTEAWKRRVSPVELENWIIDVADMCIAEGRPAMVIGIEKEKYGIFLGDILQKKRPDLPVWLWENRGKPREVRHDELIPHWANRKILCRRGLEQYEDELKTYYRKKQTNVDIIDTIWGHFQFKLPPMKAGLVTDHSKHQIEKELEDFEKQATMGRFDRESEKFRIAKSF